MSIPHGLPLRDFLIVVMVKMMSGIRLPCPIIKRILYQRSSLLAASEENNLKFLKGLVIIFNPFFVLMIINSNPPRSITSPLERLTISGHLLLMPGYSNGIFVFTHQKHRLPMMNVRKLFLSLRFL